MTEPTKIYISQEDLDSVVNLRGYSDTEVDDCLEGCRAVMLTARANGVNDMRFYNVVGMRMRVLLVEKSARSDGPITFMAPVI